MRATKLRYAPHSKAFLHEDSSHRGNFSSGKTLMKPPAPVNGTSYETEPSRCLAREPKRGIANAASKHMHRPHKTWKIS